MALKDFPSTICLIPTLGGGIGIVEVDEGIEYPSSVRYVRVDTVNALLSKAYNSGLENKKGFTDLSTVEIKK
jgi:hypothetical protein